MTFKRIDILTCINRAKCYIVAQEISGCDSNSAFTTLPSAAGTPLFMFLAKKNEKKDQYKKDQWIAIHNVGGNPSYLRSAAVIECAMLHRILTGIAIMVIVPCLCLTALCCCWPCIFCNIHSFGAQFWNPKVEVLVLTELPNSAASKVRVCLRLRICVSLIEHVLLLDPLLA